MKRFDIGKMVLESIVGVVVSAAAGIYFKKLKEQKKKESFDSTMVGDLTVAELRRVLKEEMEA